uniref:Uncharacterized protein n=1 Tax=Rhizophora mucronata TaxID=61149 RepID=A0A2P2PA84_RHIMU
MATSFCQKTSCCSQRVIDMEALAERMLDGYPKYTPYLRCVGLETSSKDKLRSQVSDISNPIILTNAKKDSFHQIARSDSFQQHTECCQEQTFSSNGICNCTPISLIVAL